MFPISLWQKKLAELKSVPDVDTEESVAHKHLVHSMFKGWEHLNDYFLAVLIARLTNSLEQSGEVLAAHLKFLQAFLV